MRKTFVRLLCAISLPTLLSWSAQAADYYDYPPPLPPAAVYVPPPAYVPVPAYVPAPYYARSFYYLPPVATYDPRPRVWYSHPPAAYYEYAPAAVEAQPLRPRSCGKYRYWNGDYCADARYRRPYVGPRW